MRLRTSVPLTMHQRPFNWKSDTATPTGKFMFTLLAAVAELERDRIKERQREGIDKARKDGKHLGRPRAANRDEVKMLMNDGFGVAEIARQMRCSRMTIYRHLK